MNIDTTELIYFSPTGTTRQVLMAVAAGISTSSISHCDLTLPHSTRSVVKADDASDEGVVLIGAPVYAGRLPSIAAERMQVLRGGGRPAVLVVVYGNRAFEDALLELCDLAQSLDFRPFVGAAFIGEHSYASEAAPIAAGRPDGADLRRARAFGAQVRDRLEPTTDLRRLPAPEIPGNRPYRAGWEPSETAARTRPELCTLCGRCADVCPVAAIAIHDQVHTDALRCIPCNACVKACPTGARTLDDKHILRIADWLNTNYAKRKDPELYW